jgi:hypothetical protein
MEKSPCEELKITQLVKKSPAFYGSPRFITIFKDLSTGPYPEPNASVHNFPNYFPKIYSNITLSSMPRSSE